MRSPRPHIAFMSRVRRTTRRLDDDRQAWRVVDDLPRVDCIDPAELDAVEAFLMPQLNAILSGRYHRCGKIGDSIASRLTSAAISCAREGRAGIAP